MCQCKHTIIMSVKYVLAVVLHYLSPILNPNTESMTLMNIKKDKNYSNWVFNEKWKMKWSSEQGGSTTNSKEHVKETPAISSSLLNCKFKKIKLKDEF